MEAIEHKPVGVYAPRAARFKGVAGLPARLKRQIEFRGDGKPREPRRIAWLMRFLEIGDGPQAARDVGYSVKSAANQAWSLRQDFAPIIRQALEVQGVMDLPLARAILLKAMRAYDPDARITVRKVMKDGSVEEWETFDPARAGSANAMAATKAAEAYMDRFGMPKVTKLDVKESVEEGSLEDFRLLIDRMVAGAGIDAVRQMPWVMEHREYREYLVGKYGGVKDVTPVGIEAQG